ncbi:MAG TPA: Holliday junction resolvase RuvX [Candidatus Binataceae bacterium]|nr:Holliday junction resolvase RuvX [Candidatus Binataceae bacterium]
MAILAIDSGLRRIGLAIADSTDSPAYPLGTLKRSSLRIDLKQIAAWIDGRGVTQLIVGLPVNMDGSEGPSARAARSFGAQLGEYLQLKVEYCDERLTSFEARERLTREGGLRRRKAAIDAVAATIILEEWLAARRNSS